MEGFGVRFEIDDETRFNRLRELFIEVKKDKDSESFRPDEEWLPLIPEAIRGNFHWPTKDERREWLEVRNTTPIAIPPPAEQLGSKWDFFSVIDSFESGEYGLLSCEPTDSEGICEMLIDPWSYSYGGLGPLIALVEAFGFSVVGVNEYGRYLTKNDLKL